MRWRLSVLAGFAIAVLACGGSVVHASNDAGSASIVDPCTGDVCKLITAAQFSDALGYGVTANSESGACDFPSSTPASTGAGHVAFVCPRESAQELDDLVALEIKNGGTPVAGIGDRAVWLPIEGNLVVISGQNAFTISVGFTGSSSDINLEGATKIAQDVIANL